MGTDLKDPWLVAVWPGMGKVALGAGSYLVEKLPAQSAGEFPCKEFFDIEKIEFKKGVVSSIKLPRSYFYTWKNPGPGKDLVVFVGEAQPNGRGFELCHKLLDFAERFGIGRVFTFAAMATMSPPSTSPRLFAVANQPTLLRELRGTGVEILDEGQISGLNGVLMAAAAERSIEGICLLGELPYVSIVVPNPRASQAILRLFTRLADIDLDLGEMEAQAERVDRGLIELMSQMKSSPEAKIEPPSELEPEEPEESEEKGLSRQDSLRLERLFEQATRDRHTALELKKELDRLGVFKEYEDRFLDLFKSGE